MVTTQKIALFFTIVGAINWGAFGLFGIDLVALLSGGATSMIAKTIYVIVGMAGLINIGLYIMDIDERKHRD